MIHGRTFRDPCSDGAALGRLRKSSRVLRRYSPWMVALLLACGEDATGPPAQGRVRVDAWTVGEDVPAGYVVSLAGLRAPIASDGEVTFVLDSGQYAIELLDLERNCTVTESPATVTVLPDTTVTASFRVACAALEARLTVITDIASGHEKLTTDTMSVRIDWVDYPIGVHDTLVVVLPEGVVEVLARFPWYCTVDGGPYRYVALRFGADTIVPLTASCASNLDLSRRFAWTPDGRSLVLDALFPVSGVAGGSYLETELYRIRLADGALTLLTGATAESVNTGHGWGPAVHPAGDRYAYHAGYYSDAGGYEVGIFVTDTLGSEHRLLVEAASPRDAAWSSDGTLIAFRAIGPSPLWLIELFVVDAEAATPIRRLTDGGVGDVFRWSPDGTRIVFETSRDGNPDIYTVDVLSGEERNLTQTPYWEENPAWSPDGSLLAFVRSTGDRALHVMNADGSNPRPLVSESTLRPVRPDWSPDGAWIAFESLGTPAIYKVRADGSDLTLLTVPGRRPQWSPTGLEIAYTASPDGSHTALFVVDADGSGARQLVMGVVR